MRCAPFYKIFEQDSLHVLYKIYAPFNKLKLLLTRIDLPQTFVGLKNKKQNRQ
jgi:hypothetical protein